MKKKIVYFWSDDKHLEVNGQKMTPEEAYKKYPKYARNIKAFVDEKGPHKFKAYINKRMEALCRAVIDDASMHQEAVSVQDPIDRIENKKSIISIDRYKDKGME